MSLSPSSCQVSLLKEAIDRDLHCVTSETPLTDALKIMTQFQRVCPLPQGSHKPPLFDKPVPSYVLVMGKVQTTPPPSITQPALIGILTETDIVNAIVTGKFTSSDPISWRKIPLTEVMSLSLKTITESKDQDLFSILSLFRQDDNRYLIIMDDQSQPIGVLMREKVSHLLQSSNILKFRRVMDLMTAPITASPEDSLLYIAQQIANAKMGSIVITESNQLDLKYPIGMITEQDILLAQSLELNLHSTLARQVMRTNLVFIKPSESLGIAHKKMQQQEVPTLIVCGTQGEIMGILTQTNLLQVLSPTEMYRTVQQLQKSVHQLQAEKLELLQSRNAELEQEVQQRTAKLHEQLESDRLLAKIALQIHQSLNLTEILNNTVSEVHQLLHADRVIIIQLQSPQVGVTVAESVSPGWISLLGEHFPRKLLPKISQTLEPEVYAISDLKNSNLSSGIVKAATKAQIKAYIIVPILQEHHLWGLLGVHQCSTVREWEQSDVNLLLQLSTQLAIAIQKAQLYQQVQNLNTDLERQVQERTAELEQKVQELQQLNILKDEFLSIVSHELRTPLANIKMAIKMLQVSPNPDRTQGYIRILENECNREIDLINDLLDLQRLEANAYRISFEKVDVTLGLSSIVDPFYSRTQNCQQSLQLEYDQNLSVFTSNLGDLKRIISELLNNACKYTPTNGKIYLKVKEVSEPQPQIKFIVGNQAPIPQKELSRIFEKFYRVPNADPWKQGGTGLGLALVQQRVKQLGGTIEVTSDEEWTIFTLSFPLD